MGESLLYTLRVFLALKKRFSRALLPITGGISVGMVDFFICISNNVTAVNPTVLMVLCPHPAPFIGQSLTLVTMARRTVIIINTAASFYLRGMFRYYRYAR
jgi:hypothetical protein